MTNAGFRLLTNFPAEIVLSDDSASAEKSDTTVNPTGGVSITLPTQPPDGSRPGITTWLSEIAVPGVLASIPVVRRVGLTVGGDLMMVGDHEPALNLDDVSFLQVDRSLQLVNEQTVKFRYIT